jgi:hypothetical protein
LLNINLFLTSIVSRLQNRIESSMNLGATLFEILPSPHGQMPSGTADSLDNTRTQLDAAAN